MEQGNGYSKRGNGYSKRGNGYSKRGALCWQGIARISESTKVNAKVSKKQQILHAGDSVTWDRCHVLGVVQL